MDASETTDLVPLPQDHAQMTTVPAQPPVAAKPTPIQKREQAMQVAQAADQHMQNKLAPADSWMVPKDIDQAYRLAEIYCKGSLVPKEFDTPQKVFTGMAYGESLGLKGIAALGKMAIVNGRASLWGDLPLALAMADRYWTGYIEYFLDDKGKRICEANDNILATPFASYCYMRNARNEDASAHIFSLNDAKQAGLYPNKPDSPWIKYTRDMLKYKARSRAIKDQFANVLNGMPIAESDFDMMPNAQGVWEVPKDQLQRPTGVAGALTDKLRGTAPVEEAREEPVVVPVKSPKQREALFKAIKMWMDKFAAAGGTWKQIEHYFGSDYVTWEKQATDQDLDHVFAALGRHRSK